MRGQLGCDMLTVGALFSPCVKAMPTAKPLTKRVSCPDLDLTRLPTFWQQECVPILLPMLDSEGVDAHGSLQTCILVCEDHNDSFCQQQHVGPLSYLDARLLLVSLLVSVSGTGGTYGVPPCCRVRYP